MADSQLSATTALLLGASVATAATLLVLFATGALSGPVRDATEQPGTRHGRSASLNGTDKTKHSSINRCVEIVLLLLV